MQDVPIGEAKFNEFSYRDPNGRLFEWRGELYRGITEKFEPLCCRLIGEGIVAELNSKGLMIDTELTQFRMEGYNLIVKHRRLPFVSYGYEWSAGMLKAAALTVLDLNLALAPHRLTAPDIHPANILFDGPTPLYVDFTAIEEASEDAEIWPAHAQQYFRQFFLYPLYMMAQGQHRMAHWLLHDFDNGVLPEEYKAVCCNKGNRPQVVERMAARLRQKLSQLQGYPQSLADLTLRAGRAVKSRLEGGSRYGVAVLMEMRREVEAIDVSFVPTEWTDYYIDDFPAFTPSSEWGFKRSTVHDVLTRLRPDSVVDIGSNRGWYSQLAASMGSLVVALELVESSVDLLFHDAVKRGYSILPLVMSIKSPSAGYGLCNRWLLPASERLKGDLVLCLALTHHMALREHLNFQQIAEALRQFTKRWLLVEFVPREDRWCRHMWTPSFPDYTVENFVKGLRTQFNSVEILGAAPDSRQLFLCEL